MEDSLFFIAPDQLWTGAPGIDLPVAVLDLDADADWPDDWHLPPCPLIGVGGRDHPLAALVDAVVEPPASLPGLIASICAQPLAAEIFIALMRMHRGEGVSRQAMLDAESLAYGALQSSEAHRVWIAGLNARDPAPAGIVRLDRRDGTLCVTLDRPDAGNAIDRVMRDALRDAFVLAATDPQVERIELSAAGKAFSLGADLAEFGTTRDGAQAHAIRARTLPARALARFRGLVDVHVQGACIGAGLELAAMGTWITARRNAWFHLPELAMGIVPGAGGCLSLPRRIGRQRTALMVLSGRRVSATLAHEWGLVDRIVDDPA